MKIDTKYSSSNIRRILSLKLNFRHSFIIWLKILIIWIRMIK